MFNFKKHKDLIFLGLITFSILILSTSIVSSSGFLKKDDSKSYYLTEVRYNQHTDLLEMLRSAKSGDTIKIFINSPGGSVSAMLEIADAIRQSEATVIAQVQGKAMSAATVIMEAADDLIVGDFSRIMVHTASLGTMKICLIDPTQRHLIDVMDELYGAYLTDGEIRDMLLKGADIHMTGREYKRRVKEAEKTNKISRLKMLYDVFLVTHKKEIKEHCNEFDAFVKNVFNKNSNKKEIK